MPDRGIHIAQPDPTKRKPTRFPGVYFRINAKGERRYQISYTDSNGTRVWKTVEGQLKDAVRERNLILERMHRGERVVQSKMTVRDLAEVYLNTQTGHLKPKTLRTYCYNVDHYIVPILGAKKLGELRVDDLADFISAMREKGMAAWTTRGCLTPLSRMFAYAMRQGYMARNPVRDLDKTERPKGDPRPMRILSSFEIGQVLAAATETYKTLLATAIFSGLRLGELLAIEWDDVDLLAGSIRVRESKTKAGQREVVIPDFLVQMLATASLTRSEGYVFQTHYGEQMKHRRVNRALEETLRRAKVDHLRFHDLRHTFASLLIGQGEDITYVADQMGHANPSITLKIYAKLFDPKDRRKEARDRMQASFGSMVS